MRGHIVGRVTRLERYREETLRPLREQVVRIADRLGYPLTLEERDDIVQRHSRLKPSRIADLSAEGLSREEIVERLMVEVGAV